MVDCDTKLKALQTSTCDTTQSGSNLTLLECHEPLFHAMSRYTKLMRIKMLRENIPKLNSQNAGNYAIGCLTNHNGTSASKLIFQQ
jgi:hypothetical protein